MAIAAGGHDDRRGGVGDVLSLLLTSARMYKEAACIFYHDVRVSLDDDGDDYYPECSGSGGGSGGGKADRFLMGVPGPRLTPPRRFVRSLTLAFLLPPEGHVHLLRDRYGPVLRDMAENGALKRLRLEIDSRFPAPDFWGGVGNSGDEGEEGEVDDDEVVRVLLAGGSGKGGDKEAGRGEVICAPRFVTRPPFQGFLALLPEIRARVPRLGLYVDARDHCGFWCAFHRVRAPAGSEQRCEGQWGGGRRFLKIRWREAVDVLAGARVAPRMDAR